MSAKHVVRFVVPTTGGPIGVRRVELRKASDGCRITVSGDFRPLAITRAFGDLVDHLRGQGLIPLRPDAAIHIVLDQDVDAGDSWQLPLTLAACHVASGGAIAAPDDSHAPLVFATGALTGDGDVRPGPYHLERKVALAATLLDGAAGGARLLLPPDAEREAVALRYGRKPGAADAAHAVDKLSAALALIRSLQEPQTPVRRSRHWAALALLACIGAGAGALGFVLFADRTTPPSGPADQTAKPSPPGSTPDAKGDPARVKPVARLVRLLAPAGLGCGPVAFGERAAVEAEADQPLPPGAALCGIVWSPGSRSPGAFRLSEPLAARAYLMQETPQAGAAPASIRILFKARAASGEETISYVSAEGEERLTLGGAP